MTSPLLRRIRHTRRWFGYGLMVLLISVALLVAVANQMLPMVERHPDRVAAWLGDRVGQRVQFSRARGEWTRRGPRFILDELRVGEGDSTLHIGRAELLVAIYSGLLPGAPLTELKVRGLSLVLEQLPDRRWRITGLPQPKTPVADPLELLEGFGELQVEKAGLVVRSPAYKLDVALPRVDLRLRVGQSRLRAGLNIWSRSGSSPMQAVLDLDRKSFDGTLWAGGDKIAVAEWSPLLGASGVRLRSGHGSLDAWAHLRQQRVDRVQVRADLRDVALESTGDVIDAAGGKRIARASHERVQMEARLRKDANGWQLDAPVLRLRRDGSTAKLDGLRMRFGEAIEIRAPDLDASTSASLLALSDHLPEAFRAWLLQAQPGLVLRDLRVSGQRKGQWRASAHVADFRLQPNGQQPGISGLSGWLAMDDRGGVLRLSPAGKARFDWPVGLRQPLDLELNGNLVWWRSGKGWTVAAQGLQVRSEGFGMDVRAELGLQGDGSAPTLDLAATLQPVSFATAKKFWIMHKMPPTTVKWLDDALVQGQVTDGRIIIAGDLDDWPFRQGEGRFDARANIRGATLRFSPDWPAGEAMDAAVVFNGPGFTVEGKAVLAGNTITSLKGGIVDFKQPWLDLALVSQGQGEKLRALMLASPLKQRYGEHLQAATIAGPANVDLELALPLRHELGERRINGRLELRKARLADSRWDIDFAEVSGFTQFSEQGFATQNLAVKFEQQPAVFNLRVGEAFTGDSGLAAIANLQGRFPPQALIHRYAAIKWLEPWLDGSSDWKVAVRIPAALVGQEALAQLQVNSDLQGTEITLPAPLRKHGPAATSFELQAALPVEKGGINLRLGDDMHMRGRLRADGTMNGLIQFGEPLPAQAAYPAQGLAVRGSVRELDAAGWIAFAAAGEGTGALRTVDVQAASLVFLDHPFANSRVQLERTATATQMRVTAATIEGTVDIPGELARGVQGRFSRLHFGAAGVPMTAAPVQADTDPAKVPPLRFTIDDLRMGQALLGKAELQTTPMANGMRVDRFRTQSKTVNLDAAGEWVRTLKGSRSNFKVEFTAGSLGKMMDALGFVGMVQGGKTKATLAGSWPGSPGAFALANLGGTLKVDVGEGRLLDVEPGGSGRILGLISLAEIPRRLTLDFSDFFAKGFAFNSMKGDFVFNDGIARTDNLRIDGPAAEVRVSGNTGLRDQTYDQRVEVLPKAGGVLPALGMLAGGPAGAAVGAVAQAVLQKPLKRTARTVYRITGPWKDPKIEVDKGLPTNKGAKPPGP